MKLKLMLASLLAAIWAGMASACPLYITIICPNDNTAAGIKVCTTDANGNLMACEFTDPTGFAFMFVPYPGTYTVCVDPSTLPPGATLKNNALCQTTYIPVTGAATEFVLGGSFCGTPPPPGLCWMTGGGTIGGKTPDFSYGGVVYPGCSPNAADGGNWNVVDHNSGLHFQGQHIIVDRCSGQATRSPKVTVRIIDFHGDGIISGIGGNPQATIPVVFVGRGIDNHDGGAGADQLYISVVDPVSGAVLLQIGDSAASPATVSTGNLQIHQSSCGK